MQVRAIDFVMLGVADMTQSLRFYRETLGMDFPGGAGWDASGANPDWAEFDSPPVALALDADGPPPGQLVLALAVDDVDAATEELRAKGVPILREPFATDVCYQAHIRGPDGNTLILHRRDDGTAG
jgi:catechol 2,3-dioxygenase-like lactoylglutathione lyase family enzyme